MPSKMPSTENRLAEFLEEISMLDPGDEFDQEAIAEALETKLGAVNSVEDAADAGWMVPRGQDLLVRTEQASYLVTIREVF